MLSILLLLKIGIEGKFLHTIEYASEINNEVTIVRLPVHVEDINEVFVCDMRCHFHL